MSFSDESKMRAFTAEDVATLCEDAADYIEQNGWYQEWFVPPTPSSLETFQPQLYQPQHATKQMYGQPACLLGALKLSLLERYCVADSDNEEYNWEVPRAVTELIAKVVDLKENNGEGLYSPDDLPSWNDDACTSEQDVLDLLRKSAKIALTKEED